MPMHSFMMSAQAARQKIMEGQAIVMDIRDKLSYQTSHIPGAVSVTTETEMEEFMKNTPKDNLVLCYCYHGNSSQQVTRFLRNKGYKNAWSVNGGFEGLN